MSLLELVNMGILFVIIIMMMTGIYVPTHVARAMAEQERAFDQVHNALEQRRQQMEPIAWDPDYAAIGMIEPKFVEGELQWYEREL